MVLYNKNKIPLGLDIETGETVFVSMDTIDRHLLFVGKSGSGKSYLARQLMFKLAKHRLCILFDPNTHLAMDMLDDVIVSPKLRKSSLFLSFTDPDSVPLMDFMQGSLSETSRDRERRKYLAGMFTTSLITTAGPGGSTAGAAFVRFKMNSELGVRLLLELRQPIALLPHLFKFQSRILQALLPRTKDTEIRDHFANLLNIGNSNQYYQLVESTVTRLNQFFNSVVLESMFSVNGGGILIADLIRRRNGIVICDFGVTETRTVEHSRLIQKLLLDAIKRIAMNRTDAEAHRYPVSVCLDEATSSGLLDMADAEALQATRKFGIHQCFLVQGTAGMKNRQPGVNLVEAVLENTAGKLIFGMASDVDAIRFAKLGIAGMDFRTAKMVKETERQKLLGYETYSRTTISTGSDGKKSVSVTPVDRPILSTEIEVNETLYTADELFYKEAGQLLSFDTGQFRYFGPEYPSGVDLYTPAPKFLPSAIKKRNDRRRQEFIQNQLDQFPYRDIDGIRRDFQDILNRHGLPNDLSASDAAVSDPENPFD